MKIDFDQFKAQFKVLPLGLRLNNPGCIRSNKSNWIGKVGSYKGFAKFANFEFGLRAMTVIIMKYLYVYRLSCVYDIIERYAPDNDGNRPIDYANYVCKELGTSQLIFKIDYLKQVLPVMIFYMTCVENGSEYRFYAFHTDGYIESFCEHVCKYIDEYLNNVVYPVNGKKETI